MKARQKTLIWTVEWILNDGTSKIGTCPGHAPIAEGYALQFPNAALLEKKKKKRQKRSHLSTSSSSAFPPGSTVSPRLSSSDLLPDAGTTVPVAPLLTSLHPLSPSSPTSSTPPVASFLPSQDLPTPAGRNLHFYLLHPNTPSPTRVLIPLSPSATLASSLRHRVVLEFPTVYALRFSPDELPTGFVTEMEHFRVREQSRINLVEATLHENQSMPEADDHAMNVPECFDAERLLDVLKRDLRMRSESRNHRYRRIGFS